jgi:nucleotide-binding universal stress UspA family protein
MSFHPKKILIGTDFSAFARAAADGATDLAKSLGARTVLVHVVPPSSYVDYDGDLARLPHDPHFREAVTARLQHAGQLELDRLRAQGADVEFLILEGHPTATICSHAEAEGFDLIVVGTQGLTGLSRLLVGSTAENIVRHSTVPVLTLRLKAQLP